jgi:hypothetical protein
MYGQAHLSWNQNGEADLAGYQVLYGTTSGIYNFTEDVGLTATPLTPAVDLSSFQQYGLLFFVIKAYDNAVPPNVSSSSAEVSKAVAPVLSPFTWP